MARLTGNPRVVLPSMLVFLTGFTVLTWLYLIGPLRSEMSLEEDAPAFASTSGTVVETSVLQRTVGARRGGKRARYEPSVSYRYAVAGVEHRGTTLQPFPAWFKRRDDAVQAVSSYAPESEVTVYYDAGDPARSVLLQTPGPTAAGRKNFGLLFGGFLGLFWLILTIATYRVFFGRPVNGDRR